jgi:hypothetical protein
MLKVFEKWGIFIVPHLPWHETVFLVSPKGLPHLVASYNTQGDMEDLSSRVVYYDGDHTFKYGDIHQNIHWHCIQKQFFMQLTLINVRQILNQTQYEFPNLLAHTD